MPSHLVVGIDGSDESAKALAWAVEDARRRQLELELVYGLAVPVVSDAYGMVMTRPDIDELCRYSESLLDAARTAAEAMDPGVAIRTRLLNGPPAAVLIDASKEAAGLVVGSRGVGAMSGRMLGSVAVRVAAKACCPVYVIPTTYDPAAAEGDPVVVGVDGSAYGDAALRLGFDEARCRDASLVVVAAYRVPWLARPVEPNLIAEFQSSESQLARRTADEAVARVRTDCRRRDWRRCPAAGVPSGGGVDQRRQGGPAHRGRFPGPLRDQPRPARLGQPRRPAGGHPPGRGRPLPTQEALIRGRGSGGRSYSGRRRVRGQARRRRW